MESAAFHRTPSALAFNAVGGYGPFLMRIQQNQVGLIARSDKSSLANLVKLGRCMTHFLYQLFDRQDTFVYQFVDADQ